MPQTSLFGSARGPLILERGRWPASDGLIGVVQKSRGHGRGTAVTHSFAIIADVEVLSGSLYFPLPRRDVIAPQRFLMVVPPRSLVPIGHASADAAVHVSTSVGVAAKMDVGTARLLHWEGPLLTPSRAGVTAALQAAPIADIAVDQDVPESMARARHYIHDVIAHPAPVREVSRRLGIAADTLTRQFRAAYAITPKAYCHRARVSDAVLHLTAGVDILETALRCGFNDLSRFYQQFRSIIGATPGRYLLGHGSSANRPAADRPVGNHAVGNRSVGNRPVGNRQDVQRAPRR